MRTLRKDKEMIKIQYKKVENDVWYREYLIYINNKFVGWICKYNKTDKKFNVFSSKLHITTSDCNDYFKTLREAKRNKSALLATPENNTLSLIENECALALIGESEEEWLLPVLQSYLLFGILSIGGI